MSKSTQLNDLNIYSNLTRDSGPAMSWSMYAINYLDLNLVEIAETYFYKSFELYLHKPFYVWNEVDYITEAAAGNFITGAGGFLQLILNGYGGIRLHSNEMQIMRPRVLPRTESMNIFGIKYRGLIFDLIINDRIKKISIKSIKNGEVFKIIIDSNETYNCDVPKGIIFYIHTTIII